MLTNNTLQKRFEESRVALGDAKLKILLEDLHSYAGYLEAFALQLEKEISLADQALKDSQKLVYDLLEQRSDMTKC